MEEAGDPCELSPVHYLQEKKKRGKERRRREKNKRIKNNLYLSIAPFINLRFDISACIYIYIYLCRNYSPIKRPSFVPSSTMFLDSKISEEEEEEEAVS